MPPDSPSRLEAIWPLSQQIGIVMDAGVPLASVANRFKKVFFETGKHSVCAQHLAALLIAKAMNDLGQEADGNLFLPGTWTGSSVARILAALEQACPALLSGAFHLVDFEDASVGRVFGRLVESVAPLRFSRQKTSHSLVSLGDLNTLLTREFEQTDGLSGIFNPPAELAELLVRLAAPRGGDRVYDPWCGGASLLLAASKTIVPDGSGPVAPLLLHGREKYGPARNLGQMLLFLNGQRQSILEDVQDLRHTEAGPGYDLVISNPPFSQPWSRELLQTGKKTGIFPFGIPPKGNGDYANIQFMLSLLTDNGRMAVICSQGVLFRGGAEQRIRARMVDANIVETVVSLPRKLFATTSIPVVLMVFNRQKSDAKVLFVEAADRFAAMRGSNRLQARDTEDIFQAHADRVSIEAFSQLSDLGAIRDRHYDLSPARYVQKIRQEENRNLHVLLARRQNLQSRQEEICRAVDRALHELGLSPKTARNTLIW